MKIVALQALTVDELRARLREAIDRPVAVRTKCPRCKGIGHLEETRRVGESAVARAAGIHTSTLNSFMRGKTGLTLERGLALMRWLEQQGAIKANFGDEPYVDQAPRSPAVREQGSARRRDLNNVAAAAAAKAGVDAINRPLQARPGR